MYQDHYLKVNTYGVDIMPCPTATNLFDLPLNRPHKEDTQQQQQQQK
jgi:hypothetical protein